MIQVFGVPIDLSRPAETIDRFVSATSCHWIVTANPEILVYAKRHPDYRQMLAQADHIFVDGFGLWLLLRLFGVNVERVTGVDLSDRLLALAVRQNWRVALVGDEAAPGAIASIKQRFPTLNIQAEQLGRVSDEGDDGEHGEEVRHRLTFFDPHVLLVGIGHPRQDGWIAKHAHEFPNLKAVVGVGGTFDFWSGSIRRSPVWMQRCGLEWLWRLIQEPKRLGRIFNAVVVFPVLFLLSFRTRESKPS